MKVYATYFILTLYKSDVCRFMKLVAVVPESFMFYLSLDIDPKPSGILYGSIGLQGLTKKVNEGFENRINGI